MKNKWQAYRITAAESPLHDSGMAKVPDLGRNL